MLISRLRSPWMLSVVMALFLGCVSQFAVAATVTLIGTVLDQESQKPISGAKVELTNANAGTGYFVGYTDANGRFSFTNVRTNLMYDLGVFADGFCPYEMRSWQAPENQPTVELKIQLIRGAMVRGAVFQSDGTTPIANAKVELRSERGKFQMLRAVESLFTDAKGAFAFPQLPPNEFSLHISLGGYLSEQVIGIRPQTGETKEYTIKLFKPASISGTVSLADDRSPLPNIEVLARGASQGVGTSDNKGFYVIGDLRPGAYKIQCRPAGFTVYESTEVIQLKEGWNLDHVDFSMKPLAPAMSVNLGRDVFLPDQDLVFQVRTFRIGQYECKIHRLPITVFTEGQFDLHNLAEQADLTAFPIALDWKQNVDFTNPYVWIDQNMKAPKKLEPGAYILRIASPGDNVKDGVLFFVTELGIVIKTGEKKNFVYATHLRTSMPVPKTKILFVPHNPERYNNQQPPKFNPYWTFSMEEAEIKKFPWAGETNDQGIYINEQSINLSEVVALSPDGHFAVSNLFRSSLIANQSSAAFVYTDRPLYRPKQTMYYKAIFRENKPEGYEIPPQSDVRISIINSQGQQIFVADNKLNEWGSVNGSFNLPADAPLGRYEISAHIGAAGQSIHFFVEEYRKPEYKVNISPEKPFYINGEELKFTVRAEYYYGAAVPNAKVIYRLYESVATGDMDQRFPSAYTQYLAGGETNTDAEGIAQIKFTPRRSSSDRKVTLEVEVEDASGRRVSSNESVPVGVGQFYIIARPKLEVFGAQKPIQLAITAKDHSDQPVSVQLQVEFTQEVWSPVRRRYVRPSRPYASISVTTDKEGNVLAEWLPDLDLNGSIEAQIIGQDKLGNQITASVSFWRMSQRSGSFDYQYPILEGILDKKSYQPGEEASLLVNTQYPENPILLTVEARDILFHQLIWPSGKTTQVKLPIPESYAPNVYIGLLLVRGKDLTNRVYEVDVPVTKGEMNVAVSADKPVYKPGETGTVKVKTTLPDGKPVPAEVSLAVVDEAIFALRSDHTPNIHNIFYGKQANWVSTTFSFPLQYFGGADKGIRLDVRKDFRDTAEWIANIYTDANGDASVPVRYPDNLTTWRLTSRAHTKDTQVGWTKNTTLVTKEIVGRMSLPRFFVEEDTLQLPTQVQNLTKENLPSIQTKLQVSGGVELRDKAEKTAQAAAGAVARELWNLSVNGASSEAVLVYQAQGKQDGDALELSAPVLPFGFTESRVRTQIVSSTANIMVLDIGKGITPERSQVSLTFTPSLAAVALGSIPYLTDFPYGCAEQTLNGYLPSILLMDALQKIKALNLSPEEKDKLYVRVQKSLNRLYQFFNPDDGGIRWFYSGESSPYLTALVVHGLLLTQQLGYPVDTNRIQRGLDFLQDHTHDVMDWDQQAYILYVMSEGGRKDPMLFEELHANRDAQSDFGLAVGSLVLFKNDMKDKAKEMRDLLRSHASKLSNTETAWEVSAERFWEWDGTSVETTAWCLLSLCEQEGITADTDPIVRWLVNHRRGDHWRSTRETGAVVTALCKVMQLQQPQVPTTPILYSLKLNGKPVQDITIKPEEISRPVTINIDSKLLKPEKNEFMLDKNSTVAGYWSFSASLFHPGALTQPIRSKHFSFTRLYERAIHTKDYQGRPRIMTAGFSSKDVLDIGQEILVSLIIEAKRDLPYMVVEDPLPSGCEVVETFLQQDDSGWKPFTHYERRDQKMVFFLEDVPEGDLHIEYIMRTELPGSFRSNPAHAWCMYYPEITSRSASNQLQVK